MLTRAVVLPILLLAPVTTGAQDLIKVQRKTLSNGVTVIVWERPSAGRVGARMFYRVDAAAERPGLSPPSPGLWS